MYSQDEPARDARANALIDEIAELERKKLAHAAEDQRLEAAKHELRAMQADTADKPPAKQPGLVTHVLVFGATATAAYLGYVLLLAR